MEIETQCISESSILISLIGRLNANTSNHLQEKLLEALNQYKNVVLDFAKLSYISSAGLRVLLIGEKESQKVNGNMKVKNVVEDVLEVLEMTGFADILQIE